MTTQDPNKYKLSKEAMEEMKMQENAPLATGAITMAKPYHDPSSTEPNKHSIGFGTPSKKGAPAISYEEAVRRFENHINTVDIPELERIHKNWDNFPDEVKVGAINFHFNAGHTVYDKKFPKMRGFLDAGNYFEAGEEMFRGTEDDGSSTYSKTHTDRANYIKSKFQKNAIERKAHQTKIQDHGKYVKQSSEAFLRDDKSWENEQKRKQLNPDLHVGADPSDFNKMDDTVMPEQVESLIGDEPTIEDMDGALPTIEDMDGVLPTIEDMDGGLPTIEEQIGATLDMGPQPTIPNARAVPAEQIEIPFVSTYDVGTEKEGFVSDMMSDGVLEELKGDLGTVKGSGDYIKNRLKDDAAYYEAKGFDFDYSRNFQGTQAALYIDVMERLGKTVEVKPDSPRFLRYVTTQAGQLEIDQGLSRLRMEKEGRSSEGMPMPSGIGRVDSEKYYGPTEEEYRTMPGWAKAFYNVAVSIERFANENIVTEMVEEGVNLFLNEQDKVDNPFSGGQIAHEGVMPAGDIIGTLGALVYGGGAIFKGIQGAGLAQTKKTKTFWSSMSGIAAELQVFGTDEGNLMNMFVDLPEDSVWNNAFTQAGAISYDDPEGVKLLKLAFEGVVIDGAIAGLVVGYHALKASDSAAWVHKNQAAIKKEFGKAAYDVTKKIANYAPMLKEGFDNTGKLIKFTKAQAKQASKDAAVVAKAFGYSGMFESIWKKNLGETAQGVRNLKYDNTWEATKPVWEKSTRDAIPEVVDALGRDAHIMGALTPEQRALLNMKMTMDRLNEGESIEEIMEFERLMRMDTKTGREIGNRKGLIEGEKEVRDYLREIKMSDDELAEKGKDRLVIEYRNEMFEEPYQKQVRDAFNKEYRDELAKDPLQSEGIGAMLMRDSIELLIKLNKSLDNITPIGLTIKPTDDGLAAAFDDTVAALPSDVVDAINVVRRDAAENITEAEALSTAKAQRFDEVYEELHNAKIDLEEGTGSQQAVDEAQELADKLFLSTNSDEYIKYNPSQNVEGLLKNEKIVAREMSNRLDKLKETEPEVRTEMENVEIAKLERQVAWLDYRTTIAATPKEALATEAIIDLSDKAQRAADVEPSLINQARVAILDDLNVVGLSPREATAKSVIPEEGYKILYSDNATLSETEILAYMDKRKKAGRKSYESIMNAKEQGKGARAATKVVDSIHGAAESQVSRRTGEFLTSVSFLENIIYSGALHRIMLPLERIFGRFLTGEVGKPGMSKKMEMGEAVQNGIYTATGGAESTTKKIFATSTPSKVDPHGSGKADESLAGHGEAGHNPIIDQDPKGLTKTGRWLESQDNLFGAVSRPIYSMYAAFRRLATTTDEIFKSGPFRRRFNDSVYEQVTSNEAFKTLPEEKRAELIEILQGAYSEGMKSKDAVNMAAELRARIDEILATPTQTRAKVEDLIKSLEKNGLTVADLPLEDQRMIAGVSQMESLSQIKGDIYKVIDDSIGNAEQYARSVTLTQNPNVGANLVTLIQNSLLGRLLHPFSRIGMNMMNEFAKREPVTNLIANLATKGNFSYKDVAGANGAIKKQEAIGKLATGTALSIAANSLQKGRDEKQGLTRRKINGYVHYGWESENMEPDEALDLLSEQLLKRHRADPRVINNFLERMGIEPTEENVLIHIADNIPMVSDQGSTFISLEKFGPIADLMEYYHRIGELTGITEPEFDLDMLTDDEKGELEEFMGVAVSTIYDISGFESIAQGLAILSDTENKTTMDKVADSYMASFSTIYGGLQRPGAIFGPESKAESIKGEEFTRAMYGKGFPGIPFRDPITVQKKRDVFGRLAPVGDEGPLHLLATAQTYDTTSLIDSEFERLGIYKRHSAPNKVKNFAGINLKSFKLRKLNKAEQAEYNAIMTVPKGVDAYEDWIILTGSGSTPSNGSAIQKLEAYFSSPGYKSRVFNMEQIDDNSSRRELDEGIRFLDDVTDVTDRILSQGRTGASGRLTTLSRFYVNAQGITLQQARTGENKRKVETLQSGSKKITQGLENFK